MATPGSPAGAAPTPPAGGTKATPAFTAPVAGAYNLSGTPYQAAYKGMKEGATDAFFGYNTAAGGLNYGKNLEPGQRIDPAAAGVRGAASKFGVGTPVSQRPGIIQPGFPDWKEGLAKDAAPTYNVNPSLAGMSYIRLSNILSSGSAEEYGVTDQDIVDAMNAIKGQ